MKYRFIRDNRSRHPLTWWFSALGVSKSGFYDWLNGPESERSKQDKHLLACIKEIHTDSRETYGAPRIHKELQVQGARCSKKRVQRLMRDNDIRTKAYRRQKRGGIARNDEGIGENKLQRQFHAREPNQRWVSDITMIPTRVGWLHLAVVMDLYSRAIVGWSMNASMTAQLVKDALTMALWRRGKPSGVLVHSDQGSQYQSSDYRDTIAEHGLIPSMSRKGNCWDNAAMESFFHTLKTELTHHERYRNREEAKQNVFEFIELFYNRKRRHSYVGYMAPLEYERLTAAGI